MDRESRRAQLESLPRNDLLAEYRRVTGKVVPAMGSFSHQTWAQEILQREYGTDQKTDTPSSPE